ncbi:MAG TPA: TetR family transcriptional regulator [Pseudonocardiaceae bacterium]|jgi:AcrR family transcriptional regulator|nr:TetR family transcriptional regulator [Pseudonocardiaceae bacterium]
MVEPKPATRSRGRRGAGADTKAALLDAAKAVFAELGYDNATVRMIAARADVDPAMVNHWFGGKQRLFAAAVLELPVNPFDLLDGLMDGPDEELGERMVRLFLTIWDTDGGRMPALVRSITQQEAAANAIRDLFVNHIVEPLVRRLGSDQSALRATLCGSQMVGLGMMRYVLKFEPLASTDREALVAAVAPNLQRYLTGSLEG